MAKYAFSSTVIYGNDSFEVTGAEYCGWEDALEACHDSKEGREWATYDFLIANGHFVSPPKSERPVAPADNSPPQNVTQKAVGVVNPGSLGDGLGGTFAEPPIWEPAWTQTRILTERDKLLREREKIIKLKETALTNKINQTRYDTRGGFRNADGDPYTGNDWTNTIAGLLAIFFLLLIAAKCMK